MYDFLYAKKEETIKELIAKKILTGEIVTKDEYFGAKLTKPQKDWGDIKNLPAEKNAGLIIAVDSQAKSVAYPNMKGNWPPFMLREIKRTFGESMNKTKLQETIQKLKSYKEKKSISESKQINENKSKSLRDWIYNAIDQAFKEKSSTEKVYLSVSNFGFISTMPIPSELEALIKKFGGVKRGDGIMEIKSASDKNRIADTLIEADTVQLVMAIRIAPEEVEPEEVTSEYTRSYVRIERSFVEK